MGGRGTDRSEIPSPQLALEELRPVVNSSLGPSISSTSRDGRSSS